MGGKGVFIKELEDALLDRSVDLAVHSMKDVPTELPSGLMVAAYCERADVRDALVSRDSLPFERLPAGARVGTGSLRRRAQLLLRRPDLQMVELRGNVDTRLAKVARESATPSCSPRPVSTACKWPIASPKYSRPRFACPPPGRERSASRRARMTTRFLRVFAASTTSKRRYRRPVRTHAVLAALEGGVPGAHRRLGAAGGARVCCRSGACLPRMPSESLRRAARGLVPRRRRSYCAPGCRGVAGRRRGPHPARAGANRWRPLTASRWRGGASLLRARRSSRRKYPTACASWGRKCCCCRWSDSLNLRTRRRWIAASPLWRSSIG